MKVTIIGAGLAGCEAALYLAKNGVSITLLEQKPIRKSPAHSAEGVAELVCSNSLGAKRTGSASGLLKEEAKVLGGTLFHIAQRCEVPAGGALAVERHLFSDEVAREIERQPLITLESRVVDRLPDGICLIATGPMTEPPFSEVLSELVGGFLSYHDAAAPIVSADSLVMEHCFAASRYGRGGDDYINCPMDKEQYYSFAEALLSAERAPLHDFDRVYEGCMPVEILASRGVDSMRFGPLKPVGLCDPATGRRPFANLQLRKEDVDGRLLNLVGFQTNLKFSEQRRVFGMIPALRNAEYVRYGVMHRNSFIDSPRVLAPDLSLKDHPDVFVAGGLTGFEGYSESITNGLLAARFILARLKGEELEMPPAKTMCGGLMRYIMTENKDFQPQGAAMGIIPPLDYRERDKRKRYELLAERALCEMDIYKGTI